MNNYNDVIGLVPAAGFARRISPLFCSKEIYPIQDIQKGSRVASSFLLDGFREAGVNQTYILLRTGKWDIPEFYKDGSSIGLSLSYVVTESTNGVPQTIDKAYSFIKGKKVVLGFPDIIFDPSDVFLSLIEKQESTGADIVLGLFKTIKPEKADMVSFDSSGSITDIIIKPQKTSLSYTWIVAMWSPAFTDFLHDYVVSYHQERFKESNSKEYGELYLGDVVKEAISSSLKIDYVKFDSGSYIDIGTPAELEKVSNGNWRMGTFNLRDGE